MKKSSFFALVLGTVSGVLFALGMCMALVPAWNAFQTGVILGALGLVLGLVTCILWRRMTHKAPIRFRKKTLLALAVILLGALMLGVGMSLCLVWNRMVLGIALGLVGIIVLLCLIPLTLGFRD